MDRFDDVESRILEAPEQPQPRPRRHGRWAFAGVAAVVTVGMLAAGASALTEQAQAPVAKPKRPALFHDADGIPTRRGGHDCWARDGKRRHKAPEGSRSPSLRY